MPGTNILTGGYGVRNSEFSSIRAYLGKTQKELAQLLGTSLKAIQSFEQGWRRIPVHVERQVLFLLAHHLPQSGKSVIYAFYVTFNLPPISSSWLCSLTFK